jgi:hypothetical protein
MFNKLLFAALLGIFVGLANADAQSGPATAVPSRVKGRILAARVQGHVSAVSKIDGQTHALKDGDSVSEQTQIVTAPGANIILVFSNGATVNLGSDSSLDIEQFDQDPFAADLKVSELKQEPGTSTTRLNLTKGELVGKVVHLNVDKGSEFTVQTPVGAAGIRGTTFRIVFRPGRNGKAFFVVTTADGTVVFRGITSAPVTIPAGKQIVATFDYTPGTTPTTPLVITTTDTSPADEALILGIEQTIVTVNIPVVFVGTPAGTPPAPPPPPPPTQPDTAPSQPAVPPPVTTPGAGGP